LEKQFKTNDFLVIKKGGGSERNEQTDLVFNHCNLVNRFNRSSILPFHRPYYASSRFATCGDPPPASFHLSML
jgi:hypothetical protein